MMTNPTYEHILNFLEILENLFSWGFLLQPVLVVINSVIPDAHMSPWMISFWMINRNLDIILFSPNLPFMSFPLGFSCEGINFSTNMQADKSHSTGKQHSFYFEGYI